MADKSKRWILAAFLIFIVVVIFKYSPELSIVENAGQTVTPLPDISFLGLIFTDSGQIPSTNPCNYGSIGSSITKTNSYLEISTQASKANVERYVEVPINNLDEFLILVEGSASGYCSQSNSMGMSISAQLRGSESGSVGVSQSLGVRCFNGAVQGPTSESFDFTQWRFQNNFDGTWSSSLYTGIGDVFKPVATQTIVGEPILRLSSGVGTSCGSQSESKGGTSNMRFYNLLPKENGFAVCKADEYWQDQNGDGNAQASECLNNSALELRFQEAIYQNIDEYFAEKEALNQNKIDALTAQIEALQSQQDSSNDGKILQLQQELESAKNTIESLQNITQQQMQDLTSIRDLQNQIDFDEKFQTTSEGEIELKESQQSINPLFIVAGLLILAFAVILSKNN